MYKPEFVLNQRLNNKQQFIAHLIVLFPNQVTSNVQL